VLRRVTQYPELASSMERVYDHRELIIELQKEIMELKSR
jgi:hypothetical protein